MPDLRFAALLAGGIVALVACSPGAIVEAQSSGGGKSGADAGRPSCAATCSGCCVGEVCHTGDDVRTCGHGGAACQICGAGDTCTAGACQAPSDPCGDVTTEGRCATATRVEVCSQPTGVGTPELISYDCPAGEACVEDGGGAGCQLVDTCTEGAVECASDTVLRTCTGGTWVETSCSDACVHSALGDFCQEASASRVITGRVVYEARRPNSARSDWGTGFNAPARGFLVAAVSVAGGTTEYLDTTVTTLSDASGGGSFTLNMPSSPSSTDYVIVYAAGTKADGSMSFVVADPRLAAGSHDIGTTIRSPATWSWSWSAASVSDGATLTITDAKGSGAARVFDYLRYVYGFSDSRWPGQRKDPLIVWLGMGQEWSCGACNWAVPTWQFGTRFAAQIFLPGGSDESYWADAVTAHELGHWIMFTFGRAVGEGGRHCVGVPSAPGLAWSEGWATWFSADARNDPIYLDKQDGTMFWLDLSSRDTSDSPWPRPVAWNGLEQDIYENEVSAMMWDLSATQGLGRARFDAALASDRMTIPDFERGYTRHTWDMDSSCRRTNVSDTGESTTQFADFLDALRCGGVSAAGIDAATEPDSHFPYPSDSPECR